MFLFLALFILAATPSMCKGQHENNCKVLPKDLYIEVGSDTEIVCQTSCVSGKIFWRLNGRRIDESQSSAVNSSHTVLTLRNFTRQRATLECCSANTDLVIGGTTIQTYLKPSNISCILDHKDQSVESFPDCFTCNWQHQIDPPQKISYTVLYDSPGMHRAEICKSQITNCITPAREIYVSSNITITVRAEADTWKADSDPHEFQPIHILKMIRPQLRVTPSSDHVFVQWKRQSFSRKCSCEVKYSKAVDIGAPSVLRRINLSENSNGMDTIEKWDSCSNYTFSVRCALDKAPWSDWSENKTVLTKLNKRDFKLCLWRKVAEPVGNGVRKVHAMWTEIPSTCQDTFTYTIKVTPSKEAMVGVNYTDTLCDNSTCDVYVNQDAHRIQLAVLYNEALLVEDSVYVPAVGESLPQVTDIQTSTLEGILLVSWKASTEPVTGYMIDWTHDGNQYYWKESNYTNTTLPDHKQPYNITVTPLFDDETGHGTQALQICSRVGDPGDVTIQVQEDAKGALVSWNVKSQEACSGVVVNYTVFYGIQNGPQLNVPVDGTKHFIYLNNLNPDTYYSVQVNATALTGTATSRETLFQTKRFDLQLITAVGVSGSIVILLVLSLGVCCAVRLKKFRKNPVPNPAFSSLALWQAPSHQEGTCPFQPFSNPSESVCDRVYTGETQRTPTSPLATGCDGNPACDQTGEYVDPATGPALVDPVEPEETQHLSSPDDSTALLPSENSPYRSQSSAENSASRFNKQCKRAQVKQTEKIAPVTVYVTLDMLQQDQGR
ncbi:interleukin-31 receptor subunit alpha-like [Anarrhichthys ocellatus]|uniref:interleukin-31 receptor subunit alpha-like n=1 Tax=Anarrhichthys ocellatus TaxID=433405 RepID=UPI0012ED997D|nr:interleukin-31 receptor subunit alpha-like [Anarrhichthys ocellatus]